MYNFKQSLCLSPPLHLEDVGTELSPGNATTLLRKSFPWIKKKISSEKLLERLNIEAGLHHLGEIETTSLSTRTTAGGHAHCEQDIGKLHRYEYKDKVSAGGNTTIVKLR